MAIPTRIELQSLRRVWREIPSGDVAVHTNLRSRVSLDENGSLIAISGRSGRLSVGPAFWVVKFERLDDVEMIAVGMLYERRGVYG